MKYYLVVGFLYFFCVVDLYGLINYHAGICYKQHQGERRSDGYFIYKGDSATSDEELTDAIIAQKYRTVGLDLAGNSYEYPIWEMLKDADVRIESVLEEENVSSVYEDTTFIPDCIVSIDQGEKSEFSYHGVLYHVYQKIDNNTYIMTHE